MKSIGSSTFNVLLAAAEVFAAGYPKSIVEMAWQLKRIHAALLIVGISCLCSLPPAIAAPGSWTQKADIPAPTSTSASCVVDGILYVVGGHYPYQTALKTVWAYDPQSNSWTRKADMPTERRFAAAAAVGGIIYVVGGSGVGWPGEAVLPVAAYDPKTDT